MSAICTAAFSVRLASGGFGLVAAYVWWLASRVKTPSGVTQDQMKELKGDIVSVLDSLMKAVAKQSKLNALAAILTTIAALLQVVQTFMPTCWG